MFWNEVSGGRNVTMLLFHINIVIVVIVSLLSEPSFSQTIYPDGGRNVIPVVRNKPSKAQPYNDGTVMAHVIGSAGMNILYYFHVLGVSCENTDPDFYEIIQKDFEFCLNKTGPLPSELRNQPLGSIPKPCVDWKIHRPCYKNLADDYDECLMNRPGLVKKGTDALRFTHAYAKFICGNIADTEAHLLDRYSKHDMIVDGVFQCFPHLQDRIVNCVKRDKVSKTLCSKFYIVHACFGKYYNDDNCQDVQPIYYMDDLFRNMSASLSCPKDWLTEDPTRPPGGGKGQHSASPGWTPEPRRKGWTSREEHSVKENPWPGERGRPWSERGPFVRGDQQQEMQHHHHHDHPPHSHKGWESTERDRGSWDRDRVRATIDPHANRPYPDTSWNNRPWADVMDRGTSVGKPWDQGRSRNEIDTRHGQGGFSTTRGPTSSYQYITTITSRRPSSTGWARDGYHQSTTPRGPGGGYKSVALPPTGFAVTRIPQESQSDEQKYYGAHSSPSMASTTSNNQDLGYNFYSFE